MQNKRNALAYAVRLRHHGAGSHADKRGGRGGSSRWDLEFLEELSDRPERCPGCKRHGCDGTH